MSLEQFNGTITLLEDLQNGYKNNSVKRFCNHCDNESKVKMKWHEWDATKFVDYKIFLTPLDPPWSNIVFLLLKDIWPSFKICSRK